MAHNEDSAGGSLSGNANVPESGVASEGGIAKPLGLLGHRQWTIAIRAIVCGCIAGLPMALYCCGIGYGARFARWM
ncbi:hypothetical protein [Bifidobacterium sp.]|jgi:hypothetical protein|uniref:hypothetical protein n=1 Tax=Bifidobacterium sp. TaxID=41200 RepID=UPI0025C04DA9|nr:hypothetical protein [Bifidobacterium sp.]MCH4210110.1 hypothetical protein [Bifidobacterium sp.]MCI1225629.1 hypothetical protein [Bifidobacterium sp.]